MKFNSPVLLFFLMIIIPVFLFFTLRTTLFNAGTFESGTFQIAGLSQQLVLERTEAGMVRINLNHAADFETALGYTHARDRLWQLEKMHRAVNSMHSVWSGENFMRADLLSRVLLETGNQSRQAFFDFSDDEMKRFDRYAAGINAFIADAGRNTPMQFTISQAEPSRWSADDVAGAVVLQQWLLETGWQQDLANLMVSKQLPPGLVPVLFGREASTAFSAFELTPGFLDQISELLVADNQLRKLLNAPKQIPPVRSLSELGENGTSNSLLTFQSGPHTPGFWYDAEVTGPGVAGKPIRIFTLPGTPVLWAGANEQKSWHPVTSRTFKNALVQAPETAASSRVSVHFERGGSRLFLLSLTPQSFTLFPDQRSAHAFSRKNSETGRLIRHFPDLHSFASGSFTPQAAPHIHFIAYDGAAGPQNGSLLQFSGLRSFVTGTLSEKPFFGESRLLEFENPEILVTHSSRLQFARNLSDTFSGFSSVASLAMAAEYLSNWDGQYNRYLTAATLTELSLIKTANNALASYLDPEVTELLKSLNLIDPEIGVFLLEAHLSAPEGASPVSNQFFARRVQEALFELESIFGPEPYEWRWGNVNQNTFSDAALCGPFAESAFIRQRACYTLEAVRNVSVLGQRDLLNSAVFYLIDGNVEAQSFTSGLLQTRRTTAEGASHVSLLMPGYSDNPFSPWFESGMNFWPFFERFTLLPGQNVISRVNLIPEKI